MTKKYLIGKESCAGRFVDDDSEIQSSQLRVSVEDGSVFLHSDHGVISVKDGTLVLHAPGEWVSTEDGFLKSDHVEGLSTIKGGVLTDPYSSASIFVESGILQSSVEDTLSLRAGVFIMPSATDPLLAEGVVLKAGTEEGFWIKEGAFTIESGMNTLGLGTDSLQVDTVGDMFTIGDGAFIVGPRTGQSGVCQSEVSQNTLTVRDGILVASPTDRLLMGENAFLEMHSQQGTLIVKEDASKLATEYTGNIHLMDKTQKALSSIEWSSIGEGLQVDVLERTRIQDSFLELSDSYSGLFIDAEGVHPSFCSLPASIVDFPPHEYFHSANLLAQVTLPGSTPGYSTDGVSGEEPQSEVHDILLIHLQEMDVGFGTMLQGAVQALRSDNVDKVRHFSISLRELFTQVLHRLSPDDAVKKWSTSNDDFRSGRPTRKARLKYICRKIDRASFRQFVEADIKALLEFINLFQGGTHGVRPEYTDSQLKTMLVRMENALRFLIEVSEV